MDPAPDRSRSDRSIPGITQTCTWVVRECTSMSGVPSAERSESSEKNHPKMGGEVAKDKTDSSLPFSSPLNLGEGRRLHPLRRLVISHHAWESGAYRSWELLIRDAKEERSVEWMSGKWNIRWDCIHSCEDRGSEMQRWLIWLIWPFRVWQRLTSRVLSGTQW